MRPSNDCRDCISHLHNVMPVEGEGAMTPLVCERRTRMESSMNRLIIPANIPADIPANARSVHRVALPTQIGFYRLMLAALVALSLIGALGAALMLPADAAQTASSSLAAK
jgi:hypothetical protein